MKPFHKFLYIYISVIAILVIAAITFLLWCINPPYTDPISEQERTERAEARAKEDAINREKREKRHKHIENQVKSQLPEGAKRVKNLNKKYKYSNKLVGYKLANITDSLSDNIPYFGMIENDKLFAISLEGDTIECHSDMKMQCETHNVHLVFMEEQNYFYFKEFINEEDTIFTIDW